MTIENEKCKALLMPKLKLPIKLTRGSSKPVTLPPAMDIPLGNYCFPLKDNYMSSKDKNLFYHYYGEEKIAEVIKKTDKYSKEIALELPDDLYSNILILSKLDLSKSITVLRNQVMALFSLKRLRFSSIKKRIKKLYDRYHFLFNSLTNQFYHMSLGANETKNYEKLIGTNKSIYCIICFIYDCNMHSQPEESFDSPQGYNLKEYLKTYKEMNECSMRSQVKMIKDKDGKEEKEGKEKIQDLALFNQLIANNCKKFNVLVQENKLSHFSSCINIDDIKTLNSMNFILDNDCDCGEYCYKQFLRVSNDVKNTICHNFINRPLPHIYEIYLSKLLQINKFDPCSITKQMRTMIKEKDSIEEKEMIHCYIIYFRLQSEDFDITKPLTKDVINRIIKEKPAEKRKGLETQRFKLIKENIRNHKIIPYLPCYHLGTEKCNSTCPCFIRGYCEKYCVCNKQLCKLFYTGCHCKGNCNTSLCPCFKGARECDSDTCQNCKEEHSLCQNQKYQKSQMKKIGIGQSSIVGWGLFALEDIEKEDLIGEYIGEMIDMDILNERSDYIDLEKSTYMFTLNDDYTVDSRTMGNILRFANHSKVQSNAGTRILFANGRHHICLYASKTITKHDEIFFDYDGQNILCDQYDWIDDSQTKNDKKKIKGPYLKANKTASFLSMKRDRNEAEIESNANTTYEMVFKYYKNKKPITKKMIINYCLRKGYATEYDIYDYVEEFMKRYKISFESFQSKRQYNSNDALYGSNMLESNSYSSQENNENDYDATESMIDEKNDSDFCYMIVKRAVDKFKLTLDKY